MIKTELQQYIYYNKYSRYNLELGRRETWEETVRRTVNFLKELVETNTDIELSKIEWLDIYWSIFNMEVLPSMRLMFSAGDYARIDNTAIYNCSYLPIDSLESFGEIMALLMNGTGAGFSIEKKYVNKLPVVSFPNGSVVYHTIDDSTKGWVDSIHLLVNSLWSGSDVIFDYTQIRPAGSILKTKGGRASGYLDLQKVHNKIRVIVNEHHGRKLSPINVYDIVTTIAEAIVSGGVRRSSTIAFFDKDDERMMNAKTSENLSKHPNRYQANNTVVYDNNVNAIELLNHFYVLFNNATGEPAFMNEHSPVPEKRLEKLKKDGYELNDLRLNPCGEIRLRPRQMCNLTTIVARSSDEIEDLLYKAHIATLIGVIQSLATHFPLLSDKWKKSAEDERLLGVSITGFWDNPNLLLDKDVLKMLKEQVNFTAEKYAKIFNINVPTATTTVKPTGSSGLLVNSAQGIHPRWSKYYARRIRVSITEPMYQVFKENNVSMIPENGQTYDNATTWVVEFPVKAPDNAVTKNDLDAITMLDAYLTVKKNYIEHNVSITVPYRNDEVIPIVNWFWENWRDIVGITLYPKNDAQYNLAPYEEITKEQYEKMVSKFPKIDWNVLSKYDSEAYNQAPIECSGGVCAVELKPELEMTFEI